MAKKGDGISQHHHVLVDRAQNAECFFAVFYRKAYAFHPAHLPTIDPTRSRFTHGR